MTPEVLGMILIAAMLFAIFIGFPISFTLIFCLIAIPIIWQPQYYLWKYNNQH